MYKKTRDSGFRKTCTSESFAICNNNKFNMHLIKLCIAEIAILLKEVCRPTKIYMKYHRLSNFYVTRKCKHKDDCELVIDDHI